MTWMILNFPFPFAMYIFLNIECTNSNKYNARTLNYNWKARFQEKRAITGPIVKSTKVNLIIAQEQYNIGKISIILCEFKLCPWHLCKHLLKKIFKRKKIHFSCIILCWGKGNKKEINKTFPRELESLSKQTSSHICGPWLKF